MQSSTREIVYFKILNPRKPPDSLPSCSPFWLMSSTSSILPSILEAAQKSHDPHKVFQNSVRIHLFPLSSHTALVAFLWHSGLCISPPPDWSKGVQNTAPGHKTCFKKIFEFLKSICLKVSPPKELHWLKSPARHPSHPQSNQEWLILITREKSSGHT